MTGRRTDGRPGGHFSEGHFSDGHFPEGHPSKGHLSDGHSSDGHFSHSAALVVGPPLSLFEGWIDEARPGSINSDAVSSRPQEGAGARARAEPRA